MTSDRSERTDAATTTWQELMALVSSDPHRATLVLAYAGSRMQVDDLMAGSSTYTAAATAIRQGIEYERSLDNPQQGVRRADA